MPDAVEDRPGLDAVPGAEGAHRVPANESVPSPTVSTDSSESNTTVLPCRTGWSVPARLGLERAQHALGRDRKLGDPDADRVEDRGRDRGGLRVVRHLADALRSVRPVGRGVLDDQRVELREVGHARREVRAELSAAVLDAGVVRVAVLEHSEPEALDRPALDLTLDVRRVDRQPDVVALPEPRHGDDPGLVVHLDLGCARCVRDRRVRRDVDPAGLGVHDRRERLELRARAGDQLAVGPGRRRRDVRHRDRALRGALGHDLAVDDLEVGRVDLELLARDLEDLLARLLGCLLDRPSRDEGRARRERPRADG